MEACGIVWVRRAELRRLLSQIKSADIRARDAEVMLLEERKENRRAERHWASMWLRHSKSFPLPKTVAEKSELPADEVRGKRESTDHLTDVQIAMRDANRIEAARFGKTQEEADADFEREFLSQMMD